MNEREFSEAKTENRKEGIHKFLQQIAPHLPDNSVEVLLNIKYDDGQQVIVVIGKQIDFSPEVN